MAVGTYIYVDVDDDTDLEHTASRRDHPNSPGYGWVRIGDPMASMVNVGVSGAASARRVAEAFHRLADELAGRDRHETKAVRS